MESVVTVQPPGLHPNDRNCKCCCDIHVKTGPLVLGCLEAFGHPVVCSLILRERMGRYHGSVASEEAQLVVLGVSLVVLVSLTCLFYGLYVEKAEWLIAQIVLKVTQIVFFAVILVGICLHLDRVSHFKSKDIRVLGALLVVCRCCRYFMNQRQPLRRGRVTYATGPTLL